MRAKNNRVLMTRGPGFAFFLLLGAAACGGTTGESVGVSDDDKSEAGGSSSVAGGTGFGGTGGGQSSGGSGAQSGGGTDSGGSDSGGTDSGGSEAGGADAGGTNAGGTGGSGTQLSECIECDEGFECFDEVAFDQCFKLCETDTPSVVLETQADVDALAALECEVITRDLIVAGPDISNISALSGLKVIEGALSVLNTESLESLSGFEGLIYIDAGINLNANTALASLSALAGMRSGNGSLALNKNPLLVTLDGLQGVKTPDGIQLINNLALTDISALSPESVFGGILFADNGAIQTVVFPDLHTIGGTFSLLGEGACTKLEMPTLDYLGAGLLIPSSQALLTVNLDSLSQVGSITITGNGALQTLGGLPALTNAESSVVITENTSLPQCEVDEIAARLAECSFCQDNDPNGVCD